MFLWLILKKNKIKRVANNQQLSLRGLFGGITNVDVYCTFWGCIQVPTSMKLSLSLTSISILPHPNNKVNTFFKFFLLKNP
jgi:hypothetical protein